MQFLVQLYCVDLFESLVEKALYNIGVGFPGVLFISVCFGVQW